jgi:hypothetical protein
MDIDAIFMILGPLCIAALTFTAIALIVRTVRNAVNRSDVHNDSGGCTSDDWQPGDK